MFLKPEIDYGSFLRSVMNCQEDVLFTTEEGDVLNLKSELSKYVFAVITQNPDLMHRAQIVCRSESDISLLRPYLAE